METDEKIRQAVADERNRLLDEISFGERRRSEKLPIEHELERRAICLKLAIDTKSVAFSLKNDASVGEAAEAVTEAARLYEAYITGQAKAKDTVG